MAAAHDHLKDAAVNAQAALSAPAVDVSHCGKADAVPFRDGPGFHGMLLFGDARMYISHLPMFHPLHDYQAIVEVRLPAAALARYRALRAAHPGKYFTFVPSNTFVLPDVVLNRKSFSGDLVLGHFERSGETVTTGVELELVRVVYFQKIIPGTPAPSRPRYLVFGQAGEYYAAHQIAGCPGLDHVLPLPASTPAQVDGDYATYEVATSRGAMRFDTQGEKGFTIPTVEHYRETGDLACD